MYVLITGGGKVGKNLTRSLLRLGHEVTLIEQRRDRFEQLETEFEHQVQHGDATELYVLERAGIARPPDLVAAGRPGARDPPAGQGGRAPACPPQVVTGAPVVPPFAPSF